MKNTFLKKGGGSHAQHERPSYAYFVLVKYNQCREYGPREAYDVHNADRLGGGGHMLPPKYQLF